MSLQEHVKKLGIRDLIEQEKLSEPLIASLQIIKFAVTNSCRVIEIYDKSIELKKEKKEEALKVFKTPRSFAGEFNILIAADDILRQHFKITEGSPGKTVYEIE